MNSANYSSSFSAALMRENLKKYWIIGAGGLVAYLIAVIFPLILNKHDSWYFSNLFAETYMPTIVAGVVLPVLTAFVLWNFLFNQSGAAFVHSLPYSRKQVFHTNNLCAALLIGVPIVITGVLLLIIRAALGPVYDANLSEAAGIMRVDVMPFADIFKWIAFVLVLNLVIYVISLTAGLLTGLPLMQPIITYGFLAIGPLMVVLIENLNECMLYGYYSNMKNTLITALSPVTTMDMGSHFGMRFLLIWLPAGVVLYFVSLQLYKIRKLERCSEVLVFKPTRPVVKYMLSLMAAAVGGLGFYYVIGHRQGILFVAGAFLGGLIAYIGLDMIIAKSIKIKGFVKGFGIMLVLMAVFFGAYYLDIFGYSKYLPDPEEVAGVCIEGLGSDAYYAIDDCSEEDCSEDGIFGEEEEIVKFLTDENNIKETIALHSDMAATKNESFGDILNGKWMYLLKDGSVVSEDDIENYDDVIGEWADFNRENYITVKYKLKNGKIVCRAYSLPSKWIDNNAHLEKIMNSSEYKGVNYEIINWDEEKLDFNSLSVYSNYCFDGEYEDKVIRDKEKIRELVKAIKLDIEELTPLDMAKSGYYSRGLNSLTLSFSFKRPDGAGDVSGQAVPEESGYEYICGINGSYKNAIALLKSWGDVSFLTPGDVKKAVVTKIDATEDGYVAKDFTVKDPELIETIIDTGIDSAWGTSSLYVVNLYTEIGKESDRYTVYFNEETGNPFEG